jgi:uncharacterized surface protein with fasciclin (FAS1) repeats
MNLSKRLNPSPWRAAAAIVGLALTAAACSDDDPAAPAAPGTVMEVAASAGTFSTLLTAVRAAGLEATLNGSGPFTVFAPTDAAFSKLPAGAIESLLQDRAALSAVLTYHVVPGKLLASDVIGQTSAVTVNGKALAIQVAGGDVRINGVKIVATDIQASNGVIHVIDAVLLPPS